MALDQTKSRGVIVEPHPGALGVPKHSDSRFVTPIGTKELSITRVLLEDGEADIKDLPRERGRRPPVFCPFCGRRGEYHLTDKRHHFAHGNGQEDCVTAALESILHRRAKALIRTELEQARASNQAVKCLVPCRRCEAHKPRPILDAGSWTSEAEEHALPNGKVLDVAAVHGDRVVLAFEICFTHEVPPEKWQALREAGTPTVELRATDLFDHEGDGKPLWSFLKPLPTPASKNSLETLELPPRSFSICGTCRQGPSGHERREQLLGILIKPAEAYWPTICATAKLPEEWRDRLILDGAEAWQTLRTARATPEKVRDERSLDPLAFDPVAFTEGAAQRLLAWRFGDEAWKDFDLFPDPHAYLADLVLRLSSEIDDAIETIQDKNKNRIAQLQFADDVLKHFKLDATRNRWVAWIGFELLFRAARYGHTTHRLHALRGRPGKYLKADIPQLIAAASQFERGSAIEQIATGSTPFLMLPSLAHRERDAARLFLALARDQRYSPIIAPGVHRLSHGHKLTEEQRCALEAAMKNRLLLLTGGAGTGKTSTIKSILSAFKRVKWLLLAPTGKATDRLDKATKGVPDVVDALTVAKFLKAEESRWIRYSGVVVDEVGFLSIETFHALLSRLDEDAPKRIILAGDHVQLPSIGPGAVLTDLLTAHKEFPSAFAHIELKKNRRAEDEGLARLAETIRHARSWPRDGIWTGALSVETIKTDLREQVDQTIRAYKVMHAEGIECQIIAPTNKLVNAVNDRMQNLFNKKGRPLSGQTSLRIGDRVICISNLYAGELTVLNGQMFTIEREDEHSLHLLEHGVPDAKAIAFPKNALDRLRLGHAITIHRSQGSQWPGVVALIPDMKGNFVSHAMLYTVATRPQRRLTIIASPKQLDRAMAQKNYRQTALADFIVEIARRRAATTREPR